MLTWNDVGFGLQEPCESHFRVVVLPTCPVPPLRECVQRELQHEFRTCGAVLFLFRQKEIFMKS
jgi:hypothetical protein